MQRCGIYLASLDLKQLSRSLTKVSLPYRIRIAAELLALTLTAIGLPAFTAAAATDPELTVRDQGIGATLASAPPRSLSDRSQYRSPRLIDSAATNSRIAQLLPFRSSNKKIGMDFSVDVTDLESGELIWSRESTRPLLPASNMKIVTGVNALRLLGPDHVFYTTVKAAEVGTVVIKGEGDATLTSGDLKLLARQTVTNLARNGILPVPGLNGKIPPIKVLVDNSVFPAPTSGPGWNRGYQPSVARPVYSLGINGRYVWNSAEDAARTFSSYLRKYGYPAKYAGVGVSDADGILVGNHPSRPLSEQVSYMLQVSENNVAEILYRQVAIARGMLPTWKKSRKAAMSSLAEIGVPTAGLSLADGSGVSRSDRLTSQALTVLLARAADRDTYPQLESIYYGGGLPLAGQSGTLAASTGRYITKPSKCATGLIRAKTGTLYDTIGLSGIAAGTDGHLKAFSILVNNRPYRKFTPLQTRRAVDRIASTITGCW